MLASFAQGGREGPTSRHASCGRYRRGSHRKHTRDVNLRYTRRTDPTITDRKHNPKLEIIFMRHSVILTRIKLERRYIVHRALRSNHCPTGYAFRHGSMTKKRREQGATILEYWCRHPITVRARHPLFPSMRLGLEDLKNRL